MKWAEASVVGLVWATIILCQTLIGDGAWPRNFGPSTMGRSVDPELAKTAQWSATPQTLSVTDANRGPTEAKGGYRLGGLGRTVRLGPGSVWPVDARRVR